MHSLAQAFQNLQPDSPPAHTVSNSTPRKVNAEEVYESEPISNEEGAWREVAERIDPQGALTE